MHFGGGRLAWSLSAAAAAISERKGHNEDIGNRGTRRTVVLRQAHMTTRVLSVVVVL